MTENPITSPEFRKKKKKKIIPMRGRSRNGRGSGLDRLMRSSLEVIEKVQRHKKGIISLTCPTEGKTGSNIKRAITDNNDNS